MQIYKAEEGFWTRVMSAIAYGLVVAMGAVWLFGALASGPRIEGVEQVWVRVVRQPAVHTNRKAHIYHQYPGV